MQVTKFPPNIHLTRAEKEGQGKRYFTPRVVTAWAVLSANAFWLPKYWKKPGGTDALWKIWASTEAHFYNCHKMKSARVPWQDSHGRQQPCWVILSPLCCLIPARKILLVALGLLMPIHFFFLVTCSELVPDQWCCTTSPPESWICLMQIPRVAGSPLFKETVSSLTQPPGTSSCETWFYQPQLFFC